MGTTTPNDQLAVDSEVMTAQLLPTDPKEATAVVTTHQQKAAAILIHNQASYDSAARLLRGIKDLRDAAEAHHRPIIAAAHTTHSLACSALNSIDNPLKVAETLIKSKIGAWTAEQTRLAEAEHKRLAAVEEQRRVERVEAEIVAAERSGAKPEEVELMIEEAEAAPAVAVPFVPTFQRAAGISTTPKLKATVTSLMQVIAYVAANPRYQSLLKVDPVVLNAFLKAEKTNLKIPGITLTTDNQVGSRK